MFTKISLLMIPKLLFSVVEFCFLFIDHTNYYIRFKSLSELFPAQVNWITESIDWDIMETFKTLTGVKYKVIRTTRQTYLFFRLYILFQFILSLKMLCISFTISINLNHTKASWRRWQYHKTTEQANFNLHTDCPDSSIPSLLFTIRDILLNMFISVSTSYPVRCQFTTNKWLGHYGVCGLIIRLCALFQGPDINFHRIK